MGNEVQYQNVTSKSLSQSPTAQKYKLKLLSKEMEYVESYKYLGCWTDLCGNVTKTVYSGAVVGMSYGWGVELFKNLGNNWYP